MNSAVNLQGSWQALCSTTDLVAGSGVVALLGGQQVALFYLPETEQQVFAIGNCDPKSGANVIGRGILGQLQGELVIASPLYKQHFRLRDGGCLEYPELSLPVWPARLNGEQVEVHC
ncbi:MAG: nitrite reductase small subunit NirD [Pseudomonadaceae bacterium]|nr:nitrite reductase small subunit NirD [Pseudomonadaceae bacterium]